MMAPGTRRKARSKALALPIGLVALVGLVASGLWWAYYEDVKSRAFRLVRPKNTEKTYDRSVPDDVSQHLRVVGVDDALIDVWVIEPRRAPRPESVRWMVILHGIGDQKRTMLGLGRRFAKHGVGAILLDLRGHGLSSPVAVSFGAKEVLDISRVLDQVERLYGELGEVGTYGPSYGGAIALLLAAREPRVTRAVSAGGFTSFRRLVRPTLVSHNRTIAWAVPGFFVDHMVHLAAQRGGFDPRDAAAEAFVDKGDARYLLVHSREDEIVPYSHAKRFVERCGSRCQLITLENATHHESLSNRPLRFEMHWFMTGGPLESL